MTNTFPTTVAQIYARKQSARHRFDGMTLIEKIDAMAALRCDLDQCFGRAHRQQPSAQSANDGAAR